MKRVLLCLIYLFCLNIVTAQVGINTNTPNKFTDLDVKNLTDEGGNIIPKGIMIPKMTTAQRDAIEVEADANSANGLLIFNVDENCYNYYDTNQAAWVSLCGQSPKSKFTIPECSNIKVHGRYGDGIPLNTSNYLSVPVSVSSAGEYSISAKPVSANGFYFDLNGDYLTPGEFTINVPGFGIPVNTSATSDGDEFIILINRIEACTVKVPVQDSHNFPEYTINCNSIAVNGTYTANVPLDSSNTITLVIRSATASIGSLYTITTDTVNGYSFSGSGTITQSPQTATLVGSGTPLSSSSGDQFFITSNSIAASGISCEATVKVATRAITVVGLGDATAYYLASGASTLNCMYRLLNNTNLFGSTQSSVCAVSSVNIPVTSPMVAGSGANVVNIISQLNPDIIIVQYSWVANTTAYITALQNFVNSGGVLIYCSDGDVVNSGRTKNAQDLVQGIFGTTTLTGTANTTEDIQLLTGAVVNQGPFRNISGQYMVRDASSNFNFTGFPNEPDATVIAWADAAKTQARAFMHNSKGFVFIGDGGPFSGNSVNNTSATSNPLIINSDYYPITGTPVSGKPTYNSFLFCNIMAWAFDYVQKNRP